MPKSPFPAAAIGLPESETCPVAALARETKILLEREEQLKEASRTLAGAPKFDNELLDKLLYDRRKFLEDHASRLLVKSGLGALFQIALVYDAAHVLFEDMDSNSSGYQSAANAFKRIERMTYSLRGFIEAITGATSGDSGAEYLMPCQWDPHRQLAKAIHGVQEADNV